MLEQSKHYALAITCGAKRGPKDTDLTFSPSSLRDFLRALAEQPAQQQCMEHGECFGGECIYPAPQPAQQQYTYASTQATKCASCGEHKHTPLRIDAMGGYVCLTCIDQKLGSLLGEFGYPEPEQPAQQQEPVAWAKHTEKKLRFTTMPMNYEDGWRPLVFGDTSPQPAQQQNEADELIRNLGFDPEQFRTEAGFINHMKLRAAIKHPEEYQAAMQPMYQKLTNCVLCGRLNPKEGACNHGVEQPAQQQEPVAYVYEREVDGFGLRKDVKFLKPVEVGADLYAFPKSSKPWVGLTDEERKEIYRQAVYVEGAIRLTEAKIKEKNGITGEKK